MRFALRLIAVTAVCAGLGVLGTPYDGLFTSAVRAVDQAGNRSAPTPATFVG